MNRATRNSLWDRRLLWILGAGAVVRLAFLVVFKDLSLLGDEEQYQQIAVNMMGGEGFALNGLLTSWRPPLYPFVLSGLYTLTGTTDPSVARAFQAVLSLGTAMLVYLLGRQLFEERVGLVAALLFTFYPSFLFYNSHILTEVVFTFLLALTAYCFAVYLAGGRLLLLVAAGVALGLAVLTREVVWPLLAVMGALVWYGRRPGFGRWAGHSTVLLLSFLLVVTPWIVRNTRVQGTLTFIATNGGPVFYAQNYEHTPLDRPWRDHTIDPVRKVRSLLPPDLTEGERQKVAFRKGIEFIRDHPGLTVHRAVIRAANLWGLEREVVGVLLQGGYGNPGKVTVLLITAVIFGAYVLTILSGITGLCFVLATRGPQTAFHLYVGATVAFITLAHAVTSGHPRYHLPLIPVLAVYAGQAWAIREQVWEKRRSRSFIAAAVLASLLLAIWIREIFFIELGPFIRGLSQFE
jgi:4-amino-4-deoxy-L-arabinose transferase-like glycosyltransferase